jgi:hypothetical protein
LQPSSTRFNRAQRRRNARLSRIDKAARLVPGGDLKMFNVNVVRQSQVAIVLSALAGDRAAAALLRNAADYIGQCNKHGPRSKTKYQCLHCRSEFDRDRLPVAVVVATPIRGSPGAVAMGACEACGRKSDEELLRLLVMEPTGALSAIWPDLRIASEEDEFQ